MQASPSADLSCAGDQSASIVTITPRAPASGSKGDKLRRIWVVWLESERYSQAELLRAVQAASNTQLKFVGIQTVAVSDAATQDKNRVMLLVQYTHGVSLSMFRTKLAEALPSSAIFGSLGNLQPSKDMLWLEGEYSSAGKKRSYSPDKVEEWLQQKPETLTDMQLRECVRRLKAERDQRACAALAPAADDHWANQLAEVTKGLSTISKDAVLDRLNQLQHLFERLLKEHTTLTAESAGKADWFLKADGTLSMDRADPEHPAEAERTRQLNWDRYQEYTALCNAAFKENLQKDAQQGVPAAKLAEAAREGAIASVQQILQARTDWPATFDYSGLSYKWGNYDSEEDW